MVNSYAKGYMAEWKLTHILAGRGYMVMRAPRSGRIGLACPDIIAAKDGKLIVLEVKSRAEAFQISMEQLTDLKKWEDVGGAKAYIVWKVSRRGWFFFHLKDVVDNKGNMGKKFLEAKGFGIDKI